MVIVPLKLCSDVPYAIGNGFFDYCNNESTMTIVVILVILLLVVRLMLTMVYF